MTFWGIWGHFEDQLSTWGLRPWGPFGTFWLCFWGLFEDRRTWCLRTFSLRTSDDFLRTFRRPWTWPQNIDFWWLRGFWWPFEEFEDTLRKPSDDLVTFCGLFEDILRTFWRADARRTLKNLTFEDHLRTVFRRTLWGPFDNHLRNFWRPQDLRTLITFWGIEVALNTFCGLLRTSRALMTFLRNLRTLWGSVENVRSEDLGYLLCIFLTFWGLSGPFEDFW